ncbi:membrane-bound lytic murein transglycosylase MltF [Neptuniibacter sp. QD48_11]|uniref:membrane-bound lytic murein transglycosylase MltF n=1 Tax=unclassified Neptuniibacter TaxID=2630693 RepID=UPI0039F4BE47
MFDISRKKDAAYALVIFLLLCIPGLLSWNSKTQLGAIIESGAIKLVTRNSPNTYFIEKGKPAGFEYDLAKAYADHLGVELELVLPDDFSSIFTTMSARDGHIAGSMLTITEERQEKFEFTQPYLKTTTTLIYRQTKGKKAPKDISDLLKPGKKLVVLANSSHAELLQDLKAQYPELTWDETSTFSSTELMEQVQNKEIDYTVVDAVTFDSQKTFFPGLKKGFDLDEPQPLAWMLSPHHDQTLRDSINRFLALESTQTLIESLKEKYFNRSNPLNFYDTTTFKKDMQTRFPKIEQYFLMAEQETGIDWQLLASIAYQESHWDPKAVSPTGVKGIMMLTNAAAKEVNVTDRTDPMQSIIGGAHYLVIVKKKIPDRIPDPDHLWFALAGYNVGYGHLEDARVLTSRAGLNPDKWDDVKKHLPLLTQERHYSTVRYGYARGYEPVHYVSNIRKYMKLLSWEMQVLQTKRQDEEADLNPDHESWDKGQVVEDLLPAL